MASTAEAIESRPYPGRGCLVARTTSGTLCFVYFLTGRSEASRNRVLVKLGNGDVAVQDRTAGADRDPLRHYVAAASRGPWVVVGNGDQVTPIADALAQGTDPLTAWSMHTYEPDRPIYTSRICLALNTAALDGAPLIGYARRSARPDHAPDRLVWSLGHVAVGSGSVMTTYDSTALDVRLSSFPQDIRTTSDGIAGILDEVWSALDPTLRIAAFALDPTDADATLSTHYGDRINEAIN
jgi:IMP cyclohydrolase-like protein